MCIKKIILAILFLGSPLLFAQVKIDSVIYKGLKRTDVQFIQKISDIKKEQFYDSLKIEDDLRFIRRLPSVSFVKAELKKDSITNKNILEYSFKENITLIPTFQVWSAVNQTAFRIGLAEFNFLGTNKQLGGFYQYNGFHSGSIAFRDAFLFSKKSGIEARLQQITSIEPVFNNQMKSSYQYTISSVEGVYLYQPNITHRYQFSATLFQEKYVYLSGDIPSDFPLFYNPTKSQLRVSHEYNKLNYHYYFVWGNRNNITAQNVFANSLFWLITNDYHTYKRVGEKGNWATRLRAGVSENNKNPIAAFAVDNNLNIRGVGNIVDRGSANLLVNTEYRQTLLEKGWFVIQGNAFLDAGTWQQSGGTFADFAKNENIRVFSGLGVRFIHKTIFNAILRLDYGVNIQNVNHRGLVFGIGQYF